MKVIYTKLGLCLFALYIICSCNNHEFLKREFESILLPENNNFKYDTILVKKINKGNQLFSFQIKYIGARKKEYLVDWKFENDSILILKQGKEFFFLKTINGYFDNDNIVPIKMDNPNEFYPFGNFINKVIFSDTSCLIKFDRYGSATISMDPFISQIEFDKKGGILMLEYFNGNDTETYRRR